MIRTVEWRPVPGYEGLYEVSDGGDVRSIATAQRPRPQPRLVKHSDDGRGYRRLRLCLNGTKRAWRVHQLVALAFLGPRPEGQEVRHRDGNRSRNVPDNLEYGTSQQNRLDAVAHRTHHEAVKTHCPAGHEYDDENTLVVNVPSGKARQCRTCNRERTRARRQRT